MTMARHKYVGGILLAGALSATLLTPISAAEDEEAGNNLAYPVLWAEEDGRPVVPGTFGTDLFTGEILDGTLGPDSTEPCKGAVQKDAGNSWQAENLAVGPDHSVTTIDWGDNIEVKDWRIGSPVRVETGLYDDALATTMKQYQMCYIGGTAETEVWGASVSGAGGGGGGGGVTANTLDSTSAMVFTSGARLTIQRIDDPTQASWDAATHRWVGSGTEDPVFNSAVYEKTADGPGTYGAELNVQGKLIYGFNWATTGLYNGEYRITFSIDAANDSFAGSGISLSDATIKVSEETEEPVEAMAGGPGGGGGGGGGGGHGGGGGEDAKNVAVVLGDQNLTYIDVGLSGGEDPPADDGGGTTPPPTTPPVVTPPPSSGGSSTAGDGSNNPNLLLERPIQINDPQQAQERVRQTARIRAPKSGSFKVGSTVVLTQRPIKTSAGVTVRWRVTKASYDNCVIRNNKGKVTANLNKVGTCRVIAWAPAPSPQFLGFREARLYRIVK